MGRVPGWSAARQQVAVPPEEVAAAVNAGWPAKGRSVQGEEAQSCPLPGRQNCRRTYGLGTWVLPPKVHPLSCWSTPGGIARFAASQSAVAVPQTVAVPEKRPAGPHAQRAGLSARVVTTALRCRRRPAGARPGELPRASPEAKRSCISKFAGRLEGEEPQAGGQARGFFCHSSLAVARLLAGSKLACSSSIAP